MSSHMLTMPHTCDTTGTIGTSLSNQTTSSKATAPTHRRQQQVHSTQVPSRQQPVSKDAVSNCSPGTTDPIMSNRMVQPGQNQIPTSSSSSRQSTRMLNSTVEAVAAVAATSSVPHPPHAQSHPHVAVPSSPESLVIRNLKKRMNRLNLNARTPSSSGPLTATGAGQSGATATTTKTPVTAAATAAAAAAALTAAIASPAVISTPLSTHTGTRSGNNKNNNNSSDNISRHNKKDRNWKNGPPATLASLPQPSSHSTYHHHRHHQGQERTGGGGGRRRHEGNVASDRGNDLVRGGGGLGGDGGGCSTTAGGGRKATGKATGVHGGGETEGGTGSGIITTVATTAIGGSSSRVGGGNSNGIGGHGVSTSGGGGVSRRRRKKEKGGGGIVRNVSKSGVNSHHHHHITHHYDSSNNSNNNQGGWVPSGVEGSNYGEVQGEGYQRGQPGSGTGTGVGTIGGGMGYSTVAGMGYSTVAGTQETGSSPGLQYNYAQDHLNRPPSYHYPDYQHQQQGYQEQFLQQQQQQYYQANQMHPSGDVQQWLHHGQHQAHQQYQQQQHQGVGVGAPDKAIRSSFLQGIKTHALEPTQLTHLTLLRYEFLMNEFVEMMRLLPALQVLDLDILSIPYCSCRTLAPPHNRQQQQLSRHRLHQHQRHQSLQHQDPSLVSQEHPYRAHPYTEAAYAWYSSQNDDSDDMDIDSDENNPASTTALCSNCIRREGLFFRNQGSTSTSGPQDQFLTVRSLTFRGTAIIPELLALFPNLEVLALEEMRYKTPAVAAASITTPSIPGDALFHGPPTQSRAHSRMSSSQGEFGSSSCYTDSGDDSLDATASLSLEAGLPIPPSRQSVMISELTIMLKNHCPLLTRLVLNEPLLVEELSREPQQREHHLRSLSSSSVGQSPSPAGSSQSQIYPASHQQSWTNQVQDQLAQLLKVIPRLKEFVAHSRVVTKCPQLLETLLEYHHPHLTSFQVLDDSQDMSHYPSIQNPNTPAVLPNRSQHHAFYSTQDIYDQQSPHQQQQFHQEQGHQYHPTFVPYGSESPTQQSYNRHIGGLGGGGYGGYGVHGGYGGYGHEGYGDPLGSPSTQPSSLLHQALLAQYQAEQLQRQQNMMRLQTSSLRVLESCPRLQVFESKIPLLLQQLIGSVPRWACGSEITVLRLEIQELTGNSGLDPEEEEVMQMFVRSLIKGSRSNTVSSSLPPQNTTASSGSGDSSSSRPTTVSPSIPPPPVAPLLPTAPGVAEAVSEELLSPDVVKNAGFGASFLGVGSKPGSGGLSETESSCFGSAALGETFQSPSPPSVLGLSPSGTETCGLPLQHPVSSVPISAINEAAASGGGGIASGWNKTLLPPPPPLAFTSSAATSSTMGSYPSGYQIEGIERLVALQFLVEHQLVYLPKLDRFLMGNRMYTIPTRERVL
ncbi:MAG: hypothetical protein J3R72DRAFT_500089 [Linnemannia gamsii]|nr:MAG: hypothetical protein J3R72DRAFT_500089 [Linnemannia gamsii]